MNPYEVLGVPKDAHAGQILKAYRRAARKHHPDKHHAANDGVKAEHAAAFREATEAYELLTDPAKRAYYDEHGTTPDNLEFTPVEQLLGSLWKKIIEALGFEEAVKTDIAKEMRRTLTRSLHEVQGERTMAIASLANVKALAGRMKKKTPGRNIFSQIVTESIAQGERAVQAAEDEMKMTEEAIALMKDFEFSFDKPPAFAFGGYIQDYQAKPGGGFKITMSGP